MSVQGLAELIGHMIAALPGVKFETLLIKRLKILKSKVLAENKGGFSMLTPMPVDVWN